MELREEDEKDRLNDLPDSLKLHILSLMPIKFAVQTCVLSRRWKSIWASMADLDLDASCHNIFWFKKFFRKLLACRSDVPLNKLSFHYRGLDKALTDSVLDCAVSHGVKHLSIKLSSNRSTPMSFLNPVLSSSQSLMTLQLAHFKGAALLESLSRVTLTNLYLFVCSFTTAESSIDPFARLVSLKNLKLSLCTYRGFFKISGPKLDSLILQAMYFYDGSKVEIVAPNVSYFVLQDTCPGEVESFVLDFPALETADVDARLARSKEEEVLLAVPSIIEHVPSPFCRIGTLNVELKKSSLPTPQSVVNYFLSGSDKEYERIASI
ncbi:hypothetical protein DITRI_Ditri07aG0163800 [Diplodiscus trichospermus]